jgi:hypothetical protein
MIDHWTIAHGLTELGSSYMMINGPHTDAVEVVPAAVLFRHMGYFPWGKGAWIHGDDEGTVLSAADVLERINQDA